MSQQTINIGAAANDGTGDPARTAFGKVNANFDELYSVGYVAPAATGVAATDTDALIAWITACGADAVLHLRPGNTYVLDKGLSLLAGQKLIGHGAVLKRCNQVSTTTTTNVTSGVNTPITVVDPTGFRSGQSVVLYDVGTGVTAYDRHERVITVAGSVLTPSTAWGLTATNDTLQVHLTFDTLTLTNGNEVRGVEFNGNKANWTFGRWESCNEIEVQGSRCIVRECYFHDLPGEGIQEGSDVYTTINTTTNPITAGGTTATVADGSVFATGDYVTLWATPAAEPYYHRVTVSGNSLTIPAPGWWFASASGTVNVYKGLIGNRYESNLIDRANGNGVHLSGSNGTQVVNNQILNVNLDPNVGHADGAVCWSSICMASKIIGNHIDTAIAGFGGLDSIDNSGCEISGNTIENTTTYAVDLIYSGTDGYGTRDVNVNSNIFRNCGPLTAMVTGSTTDETKYIQNISITGNQFYKTRSVLQRVRGLTVTGNSFDWGAYDTTSTSKLIDMSNGIANCAVSGNSFLGGYLAIVTSGAMLNVTINGNTIRDPYYHGINHSGSSSSAVVISNNSITNGASANAGSGTGIQLGSSASSGTIACGNIVALTTGYAAIRVQGSGAAVFNNVVSNAAYNGSTRFDIRIETGLTGYVARSNKTANPISDVPGLSPIPNEQLLFVGRALNLQSTADQALTQWESEQVTRYMVTRVTAICKTGGATVACAGGIYTAASKGGTALVAAGQSWLNLSAANKIVQATLEAVNTNDSQSAAPLYFSLTTGSTAAATADVFVYGTVLD